MRTQDNNDESSDVDRNFFDRLRSLIGRDCEYLGEQCRLIAVLPQDGLLVLELRENLPPIQTDQYGQANFRSNEFVQVPIFGTEAALTDEVMDVLTALGRQ
jgi:hypothetical protein